MAAARSPCAASHRAPCEEIEKAKPQTGGTVPGLLDQFGFNTENHEYRHCQRTHVVEAGRLAFFQDQRLRLR
jgi:hypothetical protein